MRKQVVAGYILELTRVRMGGDDTAGAGGGCGVSTAVIDRGWVAHAASIVWRALLVCVVCVRRCCCGACACIHMRAAVSVGRVSSLAVRVAAAVADERV